MCKSVKGGLMARGSAQSWYLRPGSSPHLSSTTRWWWWWWWWWQHQYSISNIQDPVALSIWVILHFGHSTLVHVRPANSQGPSARIILGAFKNLVTVLTDGNVPSGSPWGIWCNWKRTLLKYGIFDKEMLKNFSGVKKFGIVVLGTFCGIPRDS